MFQAWVEFSAPLQHLALVLAPECEAWVIPIRSYSSLRWTLLFNYPE